MPSELHQCFGADDTKRGQKRQDNRHVEDKAKGNNQHKQKVQVAFHRNQRTLSKHRQ